MIDALTTSALFLGNARSDAADRSARQPGTVPADRPIGNAGTGGPNTANGPNLTAAPVPPLDISSQTTAQQEQQPKDGRQQSSDQTTGQTSGQAPDQAPDQATDQAADQASGQASPLTGKKDGEGPDGLTEAERKEVQKLKQRDREVRAHEAAHKAAGGSLASAPSYETVTGPDGRSYAVAGEVKIDTSPVPNNPEATIRKMEVVRRAALAPSQPSAQDRQVAADAAAKIQQARAEKREQDAEEREEIQGSGETKPGEPTFGDFDRAPLDPSENTGGPSADDRGDRPGRNGGNTQPAVTIDPGTLLDLVA